MGRDRQAGQGREFVIRNISVRMNALALLALVGCVTMAPVTACPELPKPCEADIAIEGLTLEYCVDQPSGVRVCKYTREDGCVGMAARLECHAEWIPAGWECPGDDTERQVIPIKDKAALPPEMPGDVPLWTWQAGSFPIMVLVDSEMGGWESEVADACRWWNDKLGREAFGPPGIVTPGGLLVIAPHVTMDGMVGYTDKDRKGSSATIRLRPLYAGGRVRAIRHELGHVLGLRHSKKVESVMWPQMETGAYDLPAEELARARSYLP